MLRDSLTGVEAGALNIAWAHALGSEGPTELDTVVSNIQKRWSNV